MAVSLISLLAGFLLTSLAIYKYIIYPAFLCPLAKIPNASYISSISNLWILWQRFTRHELSSIHRAHEKNGPVVRLGPNEISVNCADGGVRTVYPGCFEKHQWYTNMFENFDGVPCMFSMMSNKMHSVQKRMVSNVYSKSYLQSSPSYHAQAAIIIMDRFLPTVSGFAATGRTVDVYPLFNFYTLDAVAAYKFGLRNGSNSIMDYERASQWFATYHGRKNWMFYVGEIPAITGALGKIGIQIIPQHVIDAMMKFDAWEFAMVDRTEKAENELADDDVHPEHIPVVYRQLKSQVIAESKKDTSPLPIRKTTIRDYVTSELIDATSAGHETAAITLTYLFYELSKTPVTQAALRKEVLGLSTPIVSPRSPVDKGPEKQDFPTAKALDSLPYLQACIMETLRLHPAVPGPQPRVTPSDCTLGPYAHLPAGVRVSAQAYSLHRNPTVFPQPESWIPERWLPSSPFVRSAEEFEPMKAEMLRWFWAFSSGGRMCVGSNLAMAMMKAVTAAVAGNFRVELVNDDGIEEEDAFTAHPKGGKCELRFVRWEST